MMYFCAGKNNKHAGLGIRFQRDVRKTTLLDIGKFEFHRNVKLIEALVSNTYFLFDISVCTIILRRKKKESMSSNFQR